MSKTKTSILCKLEYWGVKRAGAKECNNTSVYMWGSEVFGNLFHDNRLKYIYLYEWCADNTPSGQNPFGHNSHGQNPLIIDTRLKNDFMNET